MTNHIDARGLACPQPVILIKKALDSIERGEITAVVDNIAARENVLKLTSKLNCSSHVKEEGGHFYFTITKDIIEHPQSCTIIEDNIVVAITSQYFGEGDSDLGNVLMKGYLYALTETKPLVKTLIFINSGVKLAVEGSEALGHIKTLQDMGTEILCCGTCLDFYKVKDKLGVGEISNMYTIVEKMNNSDKTIKL